MPVLRLLCRLNVLCHSVAELYVGCFSFGTNMQSGLILLANHMDLVFALSIMLPAGVDVLCYRQGRSSVTNEMTVSTHTMIT
jgi:hypothetical protein